MFLRRITSYKIKRYDLYKYIKNIRKKGELNNDEGNEKKS